MTVTPPPVAELDFLKITSNHNDFRKKLENLNFDRIELREYVLHVGLSWVRLGKQHLEEAQQMNSLGIQRATFSRAYYAAYNASKGARYLKAGAVSLKGDDHSKAGELPGGFPDVQKWAALIGKLYENRLRADYDNWQSTTSEFSQTPAEAVETAQAFIDLVVSYLKNEFGVDA